MAEFANPKIFGFNYIQQAYGGSVSVSSGSSTMWYATDNNKYTRWTTSDQSGTADLAYWIRDFGVARDVTDIYIYQSNIKNINCVYGTSDTQLPNAVVTRTVDGMHHHFKFDSVNTTQFKLSGTGTLVNNEEKYINEVYAFSEIGTFDYPVNFKGKLVKSQVDHKLENGKHFVINKGNALEGELQFRSHVSTNDVELFNTIVFRDSEFHLWLNGGNESQFKYPFYPYRFCDMFKVSLIKDIQPSYTDNYYKAGLNAKLKIVEVE